MLIICGFAAVGVVSGYFFANMRADGVRAPIILPVLFTLAAVGFAAAIFFFYIRPQHGGRSLRALLLFFLGHMLLVALLWKMGVLG
jgi:uncharacterized membrane-anchored protein